MDHARGTTAPNGRVHFSEEGAYPGTGQTVTTTFDSWLSDASPTFNGSGSGLAVQVNGGTQTTVAYEMDPRWVQFRWPQSIEKKLGIRTLSKATISYAETQVEGQSTTATADDIWVVSATRREFWGTGAADYLETVTKRYRPDTMVQKAGLRDRFYSVQTPAGTKQSYFYEFGTYSGGTFIAADTGPDLRISIISGAASGGNQVTGLSGSQKIDPIYLHAKRSTKMVEILQRGRLVRREMFVYLSGQGDLPVFTPAASPVMWESFEYTDDGRLKKRYGSNNTSLEISWLGARKAWEMDETTLKTHYVYDSRNRIAVTRREQVGTLPEVRTEVEYDASDRVRFTVIGPGDTRGNLSAAQVANKLITEVQYDLGGRVKKRISPGGATDGSTVAPGITVSYSYAYDDREITETLPSGSAGEVATKTTKRFMDGQMRSVSGTAVAVEEHYSYAFNASNQLQTTVRHATGANKRPKTTTVDLLGRVVEEQVDGFVTGTNPAKPIITKYGYHAKGLVNSITVVEMTGATPLPIAGERVTEYDPDFGTVTASGLNLNGAAGLQEASNDRFSTTETKFDQDTATSSWWTVTTTKVYDTNGTNHALTASQWARVSGFPAGVVSQVDHYDFRGSRSAEIVALDGTGKARVVSALAPDGTTRTKTMVGGAVVSEKVTSHLGATTHTTTLSYDAYGRQIQESDARAVVSRTEYHVRTAQPWKMYDGRNEQNQEILAATLTYDSAGRVANKTDAKNATVTTTYYATGQVRRRAGTGVHPVEFVYDQLGQQTELLTFRNGTGGTADRTVWDYDDNTGWLKAKKFGVDSAGTATQTVSYGYSFASPYRLVTRSSLRGITVTNKYALNTGELMIVDYSDSTPDLSYLYTRTGQLDSVTDATGTRAFIYDAEQMNAESLSASWHGPAHNGLVLTTQFDHNVPGNESAKVVPGRYAGFTFGTPAVPQREMKVTLAYDAFGRVKKVTANHLDQTINGVNRPGATNAYNYQYTANTDFWESVNNGAFTQERRLETARDILKRATGKWSATTVNEHIYTSTNAGDRETVVQSGTAFSGSALDGYGEATWVKYGYNSRGELETAAGYLGGAITDLSRPLPGRGYGFTYDTAGNRVTASVDGDPVSYTDGAGNVGANLLNQAKQRGTLKTHVSGVASATATVTVDGTSPQRGANQRYWDAALNPVGEYRQIAVSATRGGQTQTIPNLWATLKPPSESFVYDAEGNLTDDSLWHYTYDAENRLVEMKTQSDLASLGWMLAPPKRQINFVYDYLGRRVEKVVRENDTITYSRRYVYTGWNLIAEFELSGGAAVVKRSYAWGLDVQGSLSATGGVGALLLEVAHSNSSLSAYQVASDGAGNVTALLSSAGNLAAVYEYDPYGQLLRCEGTEAKQNPFTFSTKYRDGESGLLYYGLRYYDPSLGRFLNRDPIEESGGSNLYAFTLNNPVTHFDRLGLETGQLDAFVVGGRKWSAAEEASYQAWIAFQIEGATAFFNRGTDSLIEENQSLMGAAKQGDAMPTATKPGSLLDISRRLGYTPISAAEKSNIGRELASVAVGFIPIVGSVASIVELISGRDYIAGTKTSRWLAAVGVVAGLVGAKGYLKGGAKIVSHVGDVADAGKSALKLADDVATLKAIRRHSERLVKGKATSSSADTMMEVRDIQAAIANKNYKGAGTGFHELNFKFAEEAKGRGFLTNLNIDNPIRTPGGFRPSRKPDYLFDGGGIYDLKPFRPSANAYDTTRQFRDIQNSTGVMPIPFYYRLW